MENTIVYVLILFSHLLAMLPAWKRARCGEMLTVADFSVISVMLYYDTGLTIDYLGFSSKEEYFTPFFNASENVLVQAILLLICIPWLFRLGSVLSKKSTLNTSQNPSSFLISNKVAFYVLVFLVTISTSIFGYVIFSSGGSLWEVRARISEQLGILVILLYLPIHILAFYVTKPDAKTKAGLIFCFVLVLASILSTSGIGQRTTVLIPILILGVFRSKIAFTKLLLFACAGLIAASSLLPIFKWQYVNTNYSTAEMVVQTVQLDISRSNVLISALEKTESFGTNVMPYPLAGYVYSVLFFVPRFLVPFKGQSTARYFTSNIVGTPVEETNWGFGIGVLEEILLNIGFWLTFPILLVYGFAIYQLDRLSQRLPSLIVPTRLSALWLCGYHLPALLLMFGSMAVVCLLLHYFFASPRETSSQFS